MEIATSSQGKKWPDNFFCLETKNTTRTAFMSSMENIAGTHIVLAYWFSLENLRIKVFLISSSRNTNTQSTVVHSTLTVSTTYFLFSWSSFTFICGTCFRVHTMDGTEVFLKVKKIVHARPSTYGAIHTHTRTRALLFTIRVLPWFKAMAPGNLFSLFSSSFLVFSSQLFFLTHSLINILTFTHISLFFQHLNNFFSLSHTYKHSTSLCLFSFSLFTTSHSFFISVTLFYDKNFFPFCSIHKLMV